MKAKPKHLNHEVGGKEVARRMTYAIMKKLNSISCVLSALIAVACLFSSCGGNGTTAEGGSTTGGSEVKLKYSSNLKIKEYPGFTEVVVRNPWDTLKNLGKYLLVDRDSTVPANLPEGTLVRVPLQNALVYSTVHAGLLSELGASGAIGGVCDSPYIKDKTLKERLATGKIVDCGSGMSADIEKIIKLQPDAILLSPFENNDRYAKIESLGIPVVECADYMETSALGRAEWMRFYGLMFGRKEESEKMFSDTEQNYLRLRNIASGLTSRPKVILDQRYGQVWNVPGGLSSTGKLIEDAGGVNPFASYRKSGSVPLAPEKVLAEAGDADVWFVRYNQDSGKSLKELAGDAPVNSRFKAFKEGRVYGCNTRYVDFYEETPFHPDRLLEDMMLIMHPELSATASHSYYSRME